MFDSDEIISDQFKYTHNFIFIKLDSLMILLLMYLYFSYSIKLNGAGVQTCWVEMVNQVGENYLGQKCKGAEDKDLHVKQESVRLEQPTHHFGTRGISCPLASHRVVECGLTGLVTTTLTSSGVDLYIIMSTWQYTWLPSHSRINGTLVKDADALGKLGFGSVCGGENRGNKIHLLNTGFRT